MKAFKRCSLSLSLSLENIMSWGDTETTVVCMKWKSRYVQITVLKKVRSSLVYPVTSTLQWVTNRQPKAPGFMVQEDDVKAFSSRTPQHSSVCRSVGVTFGRIRALCMGPLVLLAWLYTWFSFALKLQHKWEDACISSWSGDQMWLVS